MLESLPKSKVDGILYDAEVVHSILPQKAPFAFVDEILSLAVFVALSSLPALHELLGRRLLLCGVHCCSFSARSWRCLLYLKNVDLLMPAMVHTSPTDREPVS